MPGQAPRNRVYRKAHVLALGTQLAHKIRNTRLRLRNSHAIAGDDDHGVRFIQSRRNTFCFNSNLLAFHSHLLALWATKTAENNADKRTVHRLTHDVAQDRT